MSDSIIQIVKNIKDSHSAQVVVLTKDGGQVYLDCVYKEDEAPNFFLAFPPGKLPKNIDTTKNCSVSLKGAEPPLVITASIDEQSGDRLLSLRAKKAVDPTSMREYFRVDMNTRITARYEPLHEQSSSKRWEIQGETIDISGTGLLGIFLDEPPSRTNITIDLYLEYYKDIITFKARVIRIRRLRKEKYRIAFHIEDIAPKDRDKIITSCLYEQRKMLRERLE